MSKLSRLIESHIEFDSHSFQVFAKLSSDIKQLSEKEALEFLGHAHLLLSGQKSLGNIDFIKLYRDEFITNWQIFIDLHHKIESKILIGEGAPSIPLSVAKSLEKRHLEVDFSESELSSIHPHWLRTNIEESVDLKGQHLCQADILSAIIVASLDSRLQNIKRKSHLIELYESHLTNSEKFFDIKEGKSGNLKLIINNKDILSEKNIVNKVEDEVRKIFNNWLDRDVLYYDDFDNYKLSIDSLRKNCRYLKSTYPKSFLLFFKVDSMSQETVQSHYQKSFLIGSMQSSIDLFSSKYYDILGQENRLNNTIDELLSQGLVSKSDEKYCSLENLKFSRVFKSQFDILYSKEKIDKILHVSKTLRYLQAMTLVCSNRDALEIKNLLQDYFDEINSPFEKDKHQSIFAIDCQFLRLTHPNGRDDDHLNEILRSDTEPSSWISSYIRELTNLRDFSTDYNWFKKRSRVFLKESVIKGVFENLLKHGFIEFDSTKMKYRPTKKNIILADGTPGNQFKDLHKELYERSHTLMSSMDCDLSTSYNSILFIDINQVEELFSQNHSFLEKIFSKASHSQLYEDSFQLNFQIYPLFYKEKSLKSTST